MKMKSANSMVTRTILLLLLLLAGGVTRSTFGRLLPTGRKNGAWAVA